jgi:hypothetical protein
VAACDFHELARVAAFAVELTSLISAGNRTVDEIVSLAAAGWPTGPIP